MNKIKSYPLRIPFKIYEKVQASAEANHRSVNSEIVNILDSVTVEKAGVVKDGNVYWNSPEGIEQSR